MVQNPVASIDVSEELPNLTEHVPVMADEEPKENDCEIYMPKARK